MYGQISVTRPLSVIYQKPLEETDQSQLWETPSLVQGFLRGETRSCSEINKVVILPQLGLCSFEVFTTRAQILQSFAFSLSSEGKIYKQSG